MFDSIPAYGSGKSLNLKVPLMTMWISVTNNEGTQDHDLPGQGQEKRKRREIR